MDPKIAKKTQDLLGKFIKKPPLTEKLLSKPPFRFLHDVMTSVIKTTGVMKGLFTDSEMNSENVKDRDGKIAFLQKAVDYVSAASGKQLSVKPAKVVAGHEPEKTNEFLQALAQAINSKVDNEDVLNSMNNKDKSSKREEKEERPRDREKSSDRRKRDEEKKSRECGEEKESRDREDKHKDRSKDREDRHKDRSRDRDDRHKDRDDRHKDREHKDREREREGRHKSGRSRQRREEEGKENDAPKETIVNGDHKSNEAPQRIQRPTSAKGSRRRMEGGNLSSDEDVPVQRQEPALGNDDVPQQVTGRLARPSSARPAPPKRKEDTAQSEPAMRLGSGKPQNLILDDGKDSDEDETFVVEDAPVQQEEPEQPPAPLVEDDDEDHGGLVKKIMESKKEYEQPRETKIDRPTVSDAQRRKQREAVQREIDKLRGSIQTLTRSANPLGKIMDYVQEDLDSMQKELEKWKEENKEHALALKREKAITERAVEPLRVQLSEVDQAIKDQLDLIGAVKSNIIRNDQKIEKMLRTIAKS